MMVDSRVRPPYILRTKRIPVLVVGTKQRYHTHPRPLPHLRAMDDHRWEPVCASHTTCKCCGTPAGLLGVVDFHKNCEERQGRSPLGLSGIPIYYHRCPQCGFIFTAAFDSFTHEQFAQRIYNVEYALVDPEHQDIRPRRMAQWFSQLLPGGPPLRILDYGSGSGRFAQSLREARFANVHAYDPFFRATGSAPPPPDGRYDCITCFEVLEHSTAPAQMLSQLASLLSDESLLLLGTRLQPRNITDLGVNWWYLAPRNGHVSLFSRPAMLRLLEPLGLRLASFDEGMHVICRRIPAFAAHFLKPGG